MKIALVSPYDWGYPGGVRTHIERLAAELRSRGHTVRILTAASGPQGRVVEYGVYKFGGVAPVHFNGSVARVSITPDLTGAIRRCLRREHFDVVHLHEPFVSSLTLAVLRIARSMGIASVGTFHASTNSKTSTAAWAYAVVSPMLKGSFRRLDGYIAVSETARAHISRYFPAEYNVIPNGIDIDYYSTPVAPIPEWQDGKLNVLFMGRMEPRKGLRFLLKAIPLVREHYSGPGLPEVRFILVGDGPQRIQFQRFVNRQGWTEVIFTGRISEEKKLSFFATADCYCAPSTGNESQGIVLLESMAAGVPTIASDIPGYRTVITNPDMGVLVTPKNPERLAWAICNVLRDSELRERLRQNGRLRAAYYSWKRVTTDIEHVYQESLARAAERQQPHRRLRAFLRGRPAEAVEAALSIAETSG